ncbi:hypothetical protein J4573_02680 [Actinomadura barringtoniae]|uniref:Uncharacterized protein n=1 Tax=Actinomadura barringtoniae TaxID=1427535 RepID=A0A939P9S3_9ACTN|nr:hypothetical protein [Actinomadura barringtoniae]MBO2445983.1 hypothetical protein [Actinomadura barringtoniae]
MAVAFAVIALAGFVVIQLKPADPLIIAGVLTAAATLLATIPPIIRALRGDR